MSVKNVSVLSTGAVQIRPEHVESDGSPLMWWLATSRRWTAPRPINVYVIEHEDGLVLFDTGQDRRSVTSTDYFPRGLAGHLYRRLAKFEIGQEETLTARLSSIGYDISDVRIAVLSHLHQDHIGGLRELQHARIVVGAAEWATLDKPFPEFSGLLTEHILLPGLDWVRVDPVETDDTAVAPFTSAHDLMGDGSMLLVPTPGHTPGSLSLLVRRRGIPPLLLVGDLTYDVGLLTGERVPGVGVSKTLLETTRKVNAFARLNPGTAILAAHDPAAASILNRANALAHRAE